MREYRLIVSDKERCKLSSDGVEYNNVWDYKNNTILYITIHSKEEYLKAKKILRR
jgi:hypothetical protein